MTQKEAKAIGIDNGYTCAEVNYSKGMTAEVLMDEALDGETNGRDYPHLNTLQRKSMIQSIWDAYDEGVVLGIKRFIRENKIT